MLKKTEGAIKNEQSRRTGNIGPKTQNEDKQNIKNIILKTKKICITDPTKRR
jgi:hypothetical protein